MLLQIEINDFSVAFNGILEEEMLLDLHLFITRNDG